MINCDDNFEKRYITNFKKPPYARGLWSVPGHTRSIREQLSKWIRDSHWDNSSPDIQGKKSSPNSDYIRTAIINHVRCFQKRD